MIFRSSIVRHEGLPKYKFLIFFHEVNKMKFDCISSMSGSAV